MAWVRSSPRRALLAGGGVLLALLLIKRAIPDSVDTVTVERREVVSTLVTTGRVRTVSRASLGALMVGTVARVDVREGDRVTAGQLLFALEDDELRAAVEEARARLAAAEAALGRIGAVDLPTATAALEAAELEAAQLARDVERLRVVYEAGGLSRRDLEAAERAAESAQARLTNARTTASSVAAGGADRRVAEAGVAQARQALDAAQARVELTRVRSPGAGTVLIRRVEPGDAVQPGGVLMEVALDGPTELLVFPDESAVASLRVGQAALASADAYPDQWFDANVARIAPVIDPQQGTIEVTLAVPEPPSFLLPDLTVSVNIETERRAGVWTLPIDLVRAPLTDTAWVLVVRDGRAERAQVDAGIRDERFIEIVSGLEPDDAVVATSPDAVKPGARVRSRPRRAED